MLNINLLKNNIPNKIEIPKRSRLSFVKFLTIAIVVIIAFCFAIFAGFYLSKKEVHKDITNLKTLIKTNTIERKEKQTTNTNNTFNVTVRLENATLNATKAKMQTAQERPMIEQKPVPKPETQRQEILPSRTQTTKQHISKPNEPIEVIKKGCFAFCNSGNLKNLKSVLAQKQIDYTIKQTPQYYYVVYVGGLEKSRFLNFESALKAKGYNVAGTKNVNGKYYADLGAMNESDKNKFLSAWKNLGFDIFVDKQQELSNKKYEVKFSCTKDVFEELNQKGFNVKTGRGAAW